MTAHTPVHRQPDWQGAPDRADSPVLAADDLYVSFGRVRALRGVSLRLFPGETRLVLGLNGAGKSTLLNALVGSVRLQSGCVRMQGRDVSWSLAPARARRGISLVPEGRGLLPGLTVRDNILLGVRTAPRSRRRNAADALAWSAEFFPTLRDRLDQDCGTLSGGEMQMLATARALVADPRVLLIDEPSLGLAPRATETVYEALDGLREHRIAVIIVEQKSVPMVRTPDAVMVLRKGQVAHETRGTMPTGAELTDIYLHGVDEGGE